MISRLEGKICTIEAPWIVLDVHGVGYRITLGKEALLAAEKNKTDNFTLWTHLVVREDALTLFGFHNKDDLDFFELLITISGIGPKTALSIMDVATIPTMRKAVLTSDAEYLSKVTGMGRKTAEKIVLGLKDKLISKGKEEGEALQNTSDSIEALKALGWSERDSRDALKKVPTEITDTGERIKAALRLLGKSR